MAELEAVTLRRAVPGDEPTLAALCDVVHEIHRALRPDVFRVLEPSELREWFAARLGSATARAWLAEAGSVAVGYVLAIRQSREENPFTFALRWCELDQIAVLPEWRRRGVGRALTRAVVEDARGDGLQVQVQSWAFNVGAHALFEGFGFVPRMVRRELAGG
jgi:GNAT superfamily N-acetyltransferase